MAIGLDIGALLTGLIGAGNAAAAQQVDWANLQFQKEQARKQYGLATAARTDAYGNKQSFDDLMKEWLVELTPTQSAITKAGEREQLASLTEDATRNRATRRRQETRALEAEQDYNRARTGYRYDQPPSEDAIMGDLARIMGSNREAGANQAASALARQALRFGRGGDIGEITKGAADAVGSGLAENILATRMAAAQESAQRKGQHQSEYLPALNQFASTMDAVGTAPQLFSNVAGEKSAEQSAMLSAIMSAIQSGSAGVGNAYQSMARTMLGSTPNLGGALSLSLSGNGGRDDDRYMKLSKNDILYDTRNNSVVYPSRTGGGSVF